MAVAPASNYISIHPKRFIYTRRDSERRFCLGGRLREDMF